MAVIMQERAKREQEEIDRLVSMPLWSRAVAYLGETFGPGTLSTSGGLSNALVGAAPGSSASAPGSGKCSGAASGQCSGDASCSSHSSPELLTQRAMPEERTAPTPFASMGPDLAGLSEAEKQHPFWRTGLGAAAARREGVAPAAEAQAGGEAGGGLTPSHTAASAAAALAARARLPPPPPPVAAPRGLYIHGDVGGGKTLVMDMFAQAVAADAAGLADVGSDVGSRVRRVHFNGLLAECHRRLHLHSMAAMAARGAVAAVAAQQHQQQHHQMQALTSSTRGAMRSLVRNLVTKTPNPSLGGHPQSIDAVLRSITAEISTSAQLGTTSTADLSSVPSMPSWSAAEPSASISSLKGWGFGDAYAGADAGGGGGGDGDGLDLDGLDGLDVQARRRLRETMRAASALAEEAAALPTCAGVLCLDEVQVTDIADASIVRGLVGHLLFYPHPGH